MAYPVPDNNREGAMLVFRQLFDPQSSTYTYLLADRRQRRRRC